MFSQKPRLRKSYFRIFFDGTKTFDFGYLCRHSNGVEIEYDPDKERLNRLVHGIGFAGAAAIFDVFRIDDEDDREDYGEVRYVALGRIGRQVVVCVWTPRAGKARIISLRKAEKDEREIYNLFRP
jgi:uncharacterized protein